jgi:hypothetical protein
MTIPVHNEYTSPRNLHIVNFVCSRLKHIMTHDVSLGGSWFKLFTHYDRDNSGMIGFDEMCNVIRKELKLTTLAVSEGEMRVLWAVIDEDGSGTLSIKEFCGFMRRYTRFGKASFKGKIPMEIIADLEGLRGSIMAQVKGITNTVGEFQLDDLNNLLRGTQYSQFGGWLTANKLAYGIDSQGAFEVSILCVAITNFCGEQLKDKSRLDAAMFGVRRMTEMGGGTTKSTSNLHNLHNDFGDMSSPMQGMMVQTGTMSKSHSTSFLPDLGGAKQSHGYVTIAGYSSIERGGPIMGSTPLKGLHFKDFTQKLKADFHQKKYCRERYEDTSFTGEAANSLTAIPIASYTAGAHLDTHVRTRWGGARSRTDKPMTIKGILPPEELRFVRDVINHKQKIGQFWKKPLSVAEGGFTKEEAGCVYLRLAAVPTMTSLIKSQQKLKDLGVAGV